MAFDAGVEGTPMVLHFCLLLVVVEDAKFVGECTRDMQGLTERGKFCF